MDELERDVLKWYNNDEYNRLGNDVSVTELLNPPRIIHLQNRYGRQDKIELKKIMPSLIGNGVHDQLQRFLKKESTINNNWKIERRLCTVVNDVRVSGRFDALHMDEILYDIKVTKVYKAMKGDYSDWEKQLNTYDWMLWKDGIDCKHLRIFMVLLDWNQGEAYRNPNYPSTAISIIPITKWDRSHQSSWIETAVDTWKSSKDLTDTDLPLCGREERWADKPIFKLYRNNELKRATKTFATKDRANAYMNVCKTKDPEKWKDGFITEDSENLFRRCMGWCDAAKYCNQFQNKIDS